MATDALGRKSGVTKVHKKTWISARNATAGDAFLSNHLLQVYGLNR